jgi:hypothetical protein
MTGAGVNDHHDHAAEGNRPMPDMTPDGRHDARVQVLTAEVRVLIGRVSSRSARTYEIWVVGRGGNGTLVRSWLPKPYAWPQAGDGSLSCSWEGQYLWLQKAPDGGVYVLRFLPGVREREDEAFAAAQAWRDLPLIVLAGLR